MSNRRKPKNPTHAGLAGDAAVEPVEVHDLVLSRFFFALPEPCAIPNGYQHVEQVGNAPDAPVQTDDPWVSLIFHQDCSRFSRMGGFTESVAKVLRRSPGFAESTRGVDPPRDLDGFEAHYTVVEAVTPFSSPDEPPDTAMQPVDFPPRTDGFNRCLRLTQDIVRSYRQATQALTGVPTYERIPSPVFHYTAAGLLEVFRERERVVHVMRPTELWAGPQLMMLDHFNFPDPLPGEYSADIHERVGFWLRALRSGDPLHLWRERLIEAHRAATILGDYGQAVTLANTSAEGLLNLVLGLLCWEEATSVDDAVRLFGPHLKGRLSNELPPRLKGNWSTKNGPLANWFENTHRLRHRVVHGGYLPSTAEARAAIDGVNELQQFLMDRLVDRRTTYPRTTLMVVAIEGLESRGLWSGQIRQFSEQTAPTEPDWRASFSGYYAEVMDRLI
jgi:hypothetical protein